MVDSNTKSVGDTGTRWWSNKWIYKKKRLRAKPKYNGRKAWYLYNNRGAAKCGNTNTWRAIPTKHGTPMTWQLPNATEHARNQQRATASITLINPWKDTLGGSSRTCVQFRHNKTNGPYGVGRSFCLGTFAVNRLSDLWWPGHQGPGKRDDINPATWRSISVSLTYSISYFLLA